MAYSKVQRQIEVYRALQRMKRARPQDIFNEVAPKAGTRADNQAFQRAVHRDLKSLQESFIIGVEYYTVDGYKIPPGEEENHKNFRLEYYVLELLSGDGTEARQYLKYGGDAILSSGLHFSIHFEGNYSNVPIGSEIISVELLSGGFTHIWFSSLDRPLAFHIGRNSPEAGDVLYRKAAMEALGPRDLVLLFSDSSISRFKPEVESGHCHFFLPKEPGEIEVTDKGSTFVGNFDANADFDTLFTKGDSTTRVSMFQGVQWDQINRPHLLRPNVALKVGDLPMIFHKKTKP